MPSLTMPSEIEQVDARQRGSFNPLRSAFRLPVAAASSIRAVDQTELFHHLPAQWSGSTQRQRSILRDVRRAFDKNAVRHARPGNKSHGSHASSRHAAPSPQREKRISTRRTEDRPLRCESVPPLPPRQAASGRRQVAAQDYRAPAHSPAAPKSSASSC